MEEFDDIKVKTSMIITGHEESHSDGRLLGVVVNLSNDTDDTPRVGSFPYIFGFQDDQRTKGMYIFFETIVDLVDYIYYGTKRVARAYMDEDTFDKYYDNDIEGKFTEHLTWMKTV